MTMSDQSRPTVPEPVVVARGNLRDLVELREVLRSAGLRAELIRPPGRGGG